MNRPSWDQYFMTMAYLTASRSSDDSTHVGAVIVTEDNAVISTGYNGAIRGEENAPQERPEKYLHIEHGERNALYNVLRHGGNSLKGCKIYVNFMSCADCARAIVQSGISEVIIHQEGQDTYNKACGAETGWDDSFNASFRIFQNIELRWWSGKLWMPSAFYRGEEYKL